MQSGMISKAEYREHLRKLVLAVVRKHGSMTVGALHERVNQLIVMHGVDGALEQVEARGISDGR